MAFESLLNPVLNPLLEFLGYFWTLMILVFVITMIITLIYKYTTNQSLMKDLKAELKAFQKQIKELKDQPEKAMGVQKKMMQTNSKYMMHSFKPMLFTFLPIIIFFGWMSAHLGYYPLLPGEEFSVTMDFNEGVNGEVELVLPDLEVMNGLTQTIQAGQVKWVLEGEVGEYQLNYKFNDDIYSNVVLISDEKNYKLPVTKIKKDGVKSITVSNKKVQPLTVLPIPWINNFGWLGTYILFSIMFSILIRKLLKVY
ncbi:hypothetical protein CEE44_02800 [Candidatus Woesearchaeota archaeon B3_Woes]|nr:MAG: hypothetical protein CEE44_02800 [Candidatus Woesearchaeota archaeon B3_Woes]